MPIKRLYGESFEKTTFQILKWKIVHEVHEHDDVHLPFRFPEWLLQEMSQVVRDYEFNPKDVGKSVVTWCNKMYHYRATRKTEIHTLVDVFLLKDSMDAKPAKRFYLVEKYNKTGRRTYE